MIIWNNGFRASRKAMLSCRYAFALSFFHSFILYFFTSCSQDQVPPEEPKPEKQEKAIAFSGNMMEEEVTRAETPLETYTTSFRVWAIKNNGPQENPYSTYQMVMPEYRVRYVDNSSSATNSSGWEYILTAYPDQTPKYWDMEAKAYRFFGIAEMSATPGTWVHNASDHTYTCHVDATNEEEAPFYTHLWFSTGDPNDYPTRQFGQPVTLEFIKPFAEVQFKFTFANPSVTPTPMLEDYDFRPLTTGQRIAMTGTVVITFPITGTETQESWESTPDPEYKKFLTAFTVPDTGYKVFPIRNQCAYKLTVAVNGVDKDCTVPAQYMNWNPGYRYTYIFKVNDDGSVKLESVEVGVTTWTDVPPVDYNLYNW